MIDDELVSDRNDLFNYSLIEDTNYHYRGQLPKFNKSTETCSQLCRYVTSDIDKLIKSEKYKDLYSIITCNEDKIIVKCMVCNENKVLSYKLDSVDVQTGHKIIEFKNFWTHAYNFHLSEFSMNDIIKHKSSKEFQNRESAKCSNKNSIQAAFSKTNSAISEKILSQSTATTFTNKAITTDIANLIIYGNFPFQLIESLPLREAIRSILTRCSAKITNIKFQSRRTVTRRVKEMVEVKQLEYCDQFLSIIKRESESLDSPFFAATNDSSTSIASIHYSVLTGSKIETTADGSPWRMKEYYLNCSATKALSLKAIDNYGQMKTVVKDLMIKGKIFDLAKSTNFILTKYLSAGFLFNILILNYYIISINNRYI